MMKRVLLAKTGNKKFLFPFCQYPLEVGETKVEWVKAPLRNIPGYGQYIAT